MNKYLLPLLLAATLGCQAKPSAENVSDPAKAVAQEAKASEEKDKPNEQTVKETAPAPAPKPVPVKPASVQQAEKLIDLQKLPKLADAKAWFDWSTNIQYEGQGKIPSAVAFYRAELSGQGWKELGSPVAENVQYLETIFEKQGFYLKLTTSSSNETTVNVTLTVLGNVDARSLPAIDGAESQNSGIPSAASYICSGDFASAVKSTRELLAKNGWIEYHDFDGDAPSSPQYTGMMLYQNGVILMAGVSSTPQYQNGTPLVSYNMLQMLPFDLPTMKDATDVKLNMMTGEHEYLSNSKLADIVTFYRGAYQDLGWDYLPASSSESDKGAALVVEANEDLRALVTIRGRDEGGFKVSVERIPGAKAMAELAKKNEENAASEASADQPATTTPADEPTTDLADTNTGRDDVEALLGDALKLAQNELNKAAPGVDPELLNQAQKEIERALKGDDDEEETDSSEPKETPPTPQVRLAAEEFPLPDKSQNVQRNEKKQIITFQHEDSLDALEEFFDEALPDKGWQHSYTVGSGGFDEKTTKLGFDQEGARIEIEINKKEAEKLSSVKVSGNGLKFGDQLPVDPSAPGELEAEDYQGLPVPTNRTGIESVNSKYRIAVKVTIPGDLASVTEFYKRELLAAEWTSAEAAADAGSKSTKLAYTKGAKKLVVLLTPNEDGEVAAELISRDAAAAKAAKVAPKPGKSRLMIGNAMQKDVTIIINGKSYPVKAGLGAEDPTKAMALDLAPGKYTVKIKAPGKAEDSESMQIKADETWGLIVLPDGGHFAEIVY